MTDSRSDSGVVGEAACRNCGTPLAPAQEYCGTCGQKRIAGRITLHEIAHDLIHAFVHIDRSVLSLIWQLLVRPGAVARDYIEGQRRRYFGPFAFLVVCIGVGAAAIALSGFPVVTTDQPNRVAAFMQSHPNIVQFVYVPVFAAACRVVCVLDRLHYAEHLVLVAYTGGMHVLWNALVIVPGWYLIAPGPELSKRLLYATLPVWPLYFAFACSQFLPGRRWVAALKGIAAIALAYAAFQGLTDAITWVFVPESRQ